MQFLCAPVLGNLSDRFGRRPVLLVSLFFAGIDYILQAVAPNLTLLFVGRVIAGVTGASFTAATAYIADVSPPEKRAQNFGLVGAAFGVGFIIGPAAGGLVGDYGIRLPFWCAAGMAFLNLLYGWFVLPESLAPENRRPFVLSNANPFKSLAILGRHPEVLILAGSAALLWLGQQAPPSVWVLYTTYRFGWTVKYNGYTLAILGACSMAVQLGLMRVLAPRLGDRGLLAIGFIFNVIGFLGIALATQGWMMIAAMMVWTICFVGGPALQSMVSQQYGADEQGAIQGALSSIQNLTGIAGPPLLTALFGYATSPERIHPLPGAPFFFAATLAVLAAALSYKTIRTPTQNTEVA